MNKEIKPIEQIVEGQLTKYEINEKIKKLSEKSLREISREDILGMSFQDFFASRIYGSKNLPEVFLKYAGKLYYELKFYRLKLE
jgi:hypothetical protein